MSRKPIPPGQKTSDLIKAEIAELSDFELERIAMEIEEGDLSREQHLRGQFAYKERFKRRRDPNYNYDPSSSPGPKS